jgi:xanthine dehydrogenase YagR molybdenum-binding subunit
MSTIDIGEPLERRDARRKVRGEATYAAEHVVPDCVHAVLVLSEIASGRILGFDASACERVPGYLGLLTHENVPSMDGSVTGRPGLDKRLLLLENDRVVYDRQPIAVAIATTLERAQEVAVALRVTYEAQRPIAGIEDPRAVAYPPKATPHDEPADMARGDEAAARETAHAVLDVTYTTPIEHHNPIEPHASIARWDGDRLTIYDATQGVFEERRKLAHTFGIPEDHVRVLSPFLGGGFGCKGSVWPHQCLAAAAARYVGRPVKLVLGRDQMFGSTGHRPHTIQHLTLGAKRDGTVVSMRHDITAHTSQFDDWMEGSGEATTMMYAFPNVDIRHRLVKTNLGTPTFMRAPGEATGVFALECALDELAYELGIDPIALRLRNYAEEDPHKELPFTSKYQRECYERGAERFGWAKRDPRPRSMRDGRELVGMGMASAYYPSQRQKAGATVRIDREGNVVVKSGTQDLGTGSYTVFAQLAARELDVPVERVRFELGDTEMPVAPNSGGSMTVGSVGSAVALACRALKEKIAASARDGREHAELEATAVAEPGEEKKQFSPYAFGAQFAEVGVDPDFGTVRIRRMFGVFDVGRVLNARTLRSQFIGGMIMGIGMALLEQTKVDPTTARFMNANLADYLLPVHADIGEIEAEVLGYPDEHINPIGTKAAGEIGIVGSPAAIANAVFHATGRRVRDLPLHPAKLV